MSRCRGALLIELGLLDYILNIILLLPALLIITPPHWSLVVAGESQVLAGFALRLRFVALLPP